MAKKYVFFYHYYNVPCQTRWSKRQPYIVMKGICSEIIIDKDSITIK